MSSKCRVIKWQKIKDIKTKKNFNGESSPYWAWVDNQGAIKNKKDNGNGDRWEPPLANPDMIVEPDPNTENVTRKIMKTGIQAIKFSPKERAILKLLAGGRTQEEVAKRLNVSRTRVAQAILRIQKKGAKFLGNKLAHGSLISTSEEETE